MSAVGQHTPVWVGTRLLRAVRCRKQSTLPVHGQLSTLTCWGSMAWTGALDSRDISMHGNYGHEGRKRREP